MERGDSNIALNCITNKFLLVASLLTRWDLYGPLSEPGKEIFAFDPKCPLSVGIMGLIGTGGGGGGVEVGVWMEVRIDVERSDELATPSLGKKTAHFRTYVQDVHTT